MSDVPQAVAEDATSASAVEHQVMDILNPGLHHHNLLQSYVRTRVEGGTDSKQDPEEFEEPCKEGHSSKPSTAAIGGNARAMTKARRVTTGRKRRSLTALSSRR